MSERITVTYDLQDYPEHWRLRNAVMPAEIKVFLERLHNRGLRIVDNHDSEATDTELVLAACNISASELKREKMIASRSANMAFEALCKPAT